MTGQIRTSPALGDWLLFAVLAAPHVLYAFVWLFPSRWRAVFRRSPLNMFAAFATALKGSDSCDCLACVLYPRSAIAQAQEGRFLISVPLQCCSSLW